MKLNETKSQGKKIVAKMIRITIVSEGVGEKSYNVYNTSVTAFFGKYDFWFFEKIISWF